MATQTLPLPPTAVTTKPEEDARLPLYEAQMERQWSQFRKPFYQQLQKDGSLKQSTHETELDCIRVLNRAQAKGLNPDQGRELAQDLIIPRE